MINNSTLTKDVASAISAGIATGLLAIIMSISFAAIVFTGELAVFLPNGIGIALVSSMIGCAVLALMSYFTGILSITQDADIIILALAAQHITTSVVDPTSESTFVTIALFIALSSLTTGLFLFILGYFNLGNLVRFIPYPVIGGFLAAFGIILIQSTFSIVVDYQFSLSTLDELFEHETFIRWLPAVIFAFILLGIGRVSKSDLALPSTLTLGLIGFLGVVLLSGESFDAVQQEGWMLGPFSGDSSWKPIFLEELSLVDWDAIINELWHILTIGLIAAIALLLNMSGLEVQADEDAQLDKELQTTGLLNLGLGAIGGFISFHSISLTMLGWRMNSKSRLTGLVLAALFLIVLVFGFSLIAYFPKFLLGGLLLFLAVSILIEWFYDGWFKMSTLDYILMALVVLIITFVGYLEGVIFGVFAATIIFVFNYSRIEIAHKPLTGRNYQSKTDRSYKIHKELHNAGDSLLIYLLKGFIFFGTANAFLSTISARLEDETLPDIKFLVLDFMQVQSIDSSATLTFTRLNQVLRKQNATLVFSGLRPNVKALFERSDFDLSQRDDFCLFSELDGAIEWCEDRLLEQLPPSRSTVPETIEEQLGSWFPIIENYETLISYMERLDVVPGEQLAQQGELSNSLYWVELGRLEAQIELDDDRQQRVRTAQSGAVMGEMALYANTARSASIIAVEPSVVYELSQEGLAQIEKDHPQIALKFHRMIAGMLSERLADTTNTLSYYI